MLPSFDTWMHRWLIVALLPLIAAPLSPAQGPPPAIQKALESLARPGAPTAEVIRACRRIRNQLSDYVDEHKTAAWDEGAPPKSVDSARKLANKIAQLDRAETLEAFVRHSAEFLLRHPDHAEFPQRLWQLAAVVEVFERENRIGSLDEPLLPVLLGGCALLPVDNLFHAEGKLLEARGHHARGQFEQEEATYRSLLENEGIGDDIRVSARFLIALSFEMQGRFDEALVEYAAMEDQLPVFPKASEGALRALMLHLEHGRFDQARAVLAKLKGVDPDLRQLTGSAADIDAMLHLDAKPGGLQSYWDGSALWWDNWLELRAELGVDRNAGDMRIAPIAEIQAAGGKLAEALAAADSKAFFEHLDLMLHGLRWSPAGITECGGALCFLAPRLEPGKQKELYGFVLEVCGNFHPQNRQLARAAQLYQTICYSDTGEAAKALEVITKFRADDPEPDEISETMLRLWAHLAVSGETSAEEPRDALAALLASGDSVEGRAQTVLYLSQLLRTLKDYEAERKLLEAELETPALRADERISAALAQRLLELSEGGEPADAFSAAVKEWSEEHAPGWLRFALPLGLEDPRLKDRDLATVLAELNDKEFGTEERVRLEFLAASSPDLPLSTKQRAFRSAFAALYGEAQTHSASRKMLRAALRDDRMPKTLQQLLLIYSLDDALSRARKRDITSVTTHPLLDRNNERIASAVQAYGRFATVDLNSADSLSECYRDIVEDGVESAELSVIAQIFESLLGIGALEEAQIVHDEVRDWKLAPGVGQNKAALRLAFTKALRRAQNTIPLARQLRDLADKYIPPDAAEAPPNPGDLRREYDLKRLPEAQAYGLLLHRLRESSRLQSDTRFWYDLAELMPRDEKQVAFSLGILEALLESKVPDLEKSFSLLRSPSILDTDDPKILERVLGLFKKHADPDGAPMSYAAMRVVEVQSRDLRQGKPTDLDAVWRGLTHPAMDNIRTPTKLRHLMAQRNRAGLRAALELIPPHSLFSADWLDTTWPALKMAGMADEAALAEEEALENVPNFIAGAARTLDLGMAYAVYDIAAELGRPDLVPADWFQFLDSQILAERDSYNLRIREAELREDWESLAKWSGLAVKEFPTYYNYYRPHGLALHRLGRDAEAIPSLEVYTKYSRDEVEWKDAADLLEKLKG